MSIRAIKRSCAAAVTASVMLIGMFAGAGTAVAEPLGPGESPNNTSDGRLCEWAHRPAGILRINQDGERRVYQLAYYIENERGLRDGVLNVHVDDADWVKQQMGGWKMGDLLGQVVIGCGAG